MNSKGEIVIRWDESKYTGTRISINGASKFVVMHLAFTTVYELRRIAENGKFRKLLDNYISVLSHLANDEDIEIIALFETEDRSKREQIWPLIGKTETDFDVTIDLYPFTEESFKKDEDLYNEVMEEGIFYNPAGIRQ